MHDDQSLSGPHSCAFEAPDQGGSHFIFLVLSPFPGPGGDDKVDEIIRELLQGVSRAEDIVEGINGVMGGIRCYSSGIEVVQVCCAPASVTEVPQWEWVGRLGGGMGG